MIKGLYSVMIPLSSWCVSNCSGCNIFKKENISHNESEIFKNILRCCEIWFLWKKFFLSNYDFFLLDERFIRKIISITQVHELKLVFHSSLKNVNENIRFLKNNKRVELLYQMNLDKRSMITMFRSLPQFMWYNIEYMFWVKDDKNHNLLEYMISKLIALGFQKISPIDYVLWTVKVRILKHLWWWRLNRLGCIIHKWYRLTQDKISIDNSIFFPSYFEVTTWKWDIRLHEPPCGFWNIIISNIFQKNSEIYKDFEKFHIYMDKFIESQKWKRQQQICNACNVNSYNFKSI